MTLNTATLNRGGAEGARGAHNSEVVGSNPTSGIIQFASFTEAGRHMLSDVKHSLLNHSLGAAYRRFHLTL